MKETLGEESERLKRSWMRHDSGMLGDYLVSDVEDPRINIQNILTRHFLIHSVFGNRFSRVEQEEIEFALVVNWLLRWVKSNPGQEEITALLEGLKRGAEEMEGISIPLGLRRIYAHPDNEGIRNQIPAFLQLHQSGASTEGIRNAMMEKWKQTWSDGGVPGRSISVMEAACGSANDYRFIHACGLGGWLDYSGFDLCEKNIKNAKGLFPDACFQVGNVFDIPAGNASVDFLIAHDLFEHLSMEGIERAVAESCRVVRCGMCIGFFNMDEIPEIIVQPVEEYHWNVLSMEKMRSLFFSHGFGTRVVHIGSMLKQLYGWEITHNPNAYSFIIHKLPQEAQ